MKGKLMVLEEKNDGLEKNDDLKRNTMVQRETRWFKEKTDGLKRKLII